LVSPVAWCVLKYAKSIYRAAAERASGRAAERREGEASPRDSRAARFAERDESHSFHDNLITLQRAASSMLNLLL